MAGMFGISIGYHRYLSHKSFKSSRWFEIFIISMGLPAGTPIQWAGNHRAHHRFADTPDDPHSPHYGGFWWAHTGWYIGSKNKWLCILYTLGGPFRALFDAFYRPRTNQQYIQYANDISSDPVFVWMSRPRNYFLLIWIYTFFVLGFSFYLEGWMGVLVAYLSYLYVYNVGDAVDSYGHIWGKKNEGSKHQATNSIFLGLLAFGDGWHGNHHDNPAHARHGKGPWQFDMSYWTLKFLSKINVVSDLKGQ